MDEEPTPVFKGIRLDWPTREIWLIMAVSLACATALIFVIPGSDRGAHPPWLKVSLRTNAARLQAGGAPGFFVDPNTANLAALDALPGIGPVLGQRIIDARKDEPFASPEDLDRRVRGIGPKILERIRPFLRFGSSAADRANRNLERSD